MMWCKGKQRGQRLHCRPMRIWREGYIVTEMGRHERIAWGQGVSLSLSFAITFSSCLRSRVHGRGQDCDPLR